MQLEIKKEYIDAIAYHVKLKNHKGGRSQIVKENKKQVALKLYPDSLQKLDKFASKNKYTRTQVIETLIELLPYIDKMG